MDDHRKVQKRREGELAAERGLLHIGWRAASGEVHPDLTDRDETRLPRERGEPIERIRSPRGGAMRMDTDRDADVIVIRGKRQGLLARRDVLRRREDALDSRLPRAFQYFGDIGRKAAIGEMCMRVDHGGRVTFTDGGAHFRRGGMAVHERSASSW